ncbi:signal transduction histidine kinase [Kribbella aluminosa]|uniref:histidine kinase n=1 Tax=Kribbella aluminosa TaxID=416017 RepID=A0ABS4UWL3_9ACTN|nr:histidine kinase [Kribbella aluminosa]MBP2355914.1 signal transduction histidine kinase [Kribbella aluminosa]
MIRSTNRTLARILVVLEVVALVGLNGDEAVRRLFLHDQVTPGGVAFFGSGVVISALVLLRRRYPGAIAELVASAFALSLICSAVGFFAKPAAPFGGDGETLALALLVGAGCHRLRSLPAAAVTIAGGLAIITSPMLRYGRDSTTLTLAVLWTILWGCSVAIGLMLRDADARHEVALAAARNRERLALARELHDLVAHHITGVVVRTQAAQVVLADGPERELLHEIEGAGAEALAAVRRLVTMLRSPEQTVPLTSDGLVEAVESAVEGHANVDLRLAPSLDDLTVAPETVSTVHRVVLESLTNVRKHAPDARTVTVAVEPTVGQGKALLRVEVRNDGIRPGRARRSTSGFGLIGMGERIGALDGTLTAGEEDDHGERGWRVLAELPLPDGVGAGPEKGTAP